MFASQPAATTFQVPGYGEGLQLGLPNTNDFGGKVSAGVPNPGVTGLPPVVWMVIFLVVGYIGLRLILED